MDTISVTLLRDADSPGDGFPSLLREHGFRVADFPLRDGGLGDLSLVEPSVLVLDPGFSGTIPVSLCRDLRARYPDWPILLVAHGIEPWEESIALEIGADAVLVRPVENRLLLAQIRALGRRLAAAKPEPGPLLLIRKKTREVFLDGRRIPMTDAEFDLLALLAARPGRIVTRDEISQELRGIPHDGLNRAIDLRVARLRRKLADDPQRPRCIRAVRGQGYLITARISA